jgi:hypothetical protein
MKPEEKALTRAIDGETTEKLPAPLNAEKEHWERLQPALREALSPPPFPHTEFLREQVLASIPRTERRPPSPRLLFFGGLGAVAASILLAMILLPSELLTDNASNSEVIDVYASDPQISVVAFAAPQSRGVVLWLEHAGYIPPEETMQ